jgi:hypothetical protein
MSEQRMRDDGTWTYATPEWDARWYWKVGTPVCVGGRWTGEIIKVNNCTVDVRLADGTVRRRVSMLALGRPA